MAEFLFTGQLKVKTLKTQFKESFGASLRVYKSVSCKGGFADDDATLASIRAEGYKGGDLIVKGNMLVGNFEAKVAELYGIGVQVATPDDSKLADNEITLTAAGREQIVEHTKIEDLDEDDWVECDNVDFEGVEYTVYEGEACATILLDSETQHLIIPEIIMDENGNKFVVTEFDINDVEDITHVTLPKTIKCVYGTAFSDSIADGNSITVDFSGEPALVFEKNIFYSADKKVLYNTQLATIGEEFIVSEGVETIDHDAFSNASALKSLELPTTIKEIYPAFSGCDMLEEVNIKAPQTSIALHKEDRDGEYTEVFESTVTVKYIEQQNIKTSQVPIVESENIQQTNMGNVSSFRTWLDIEEKIETYVVKCVEKYISFFSANKVIGYLSFLCLTSVFALLSYLAMYYYLVKFTVRVIMFVKKDYIVIPKEQKVTLWSILKTTWKEYNVWTSSNKLWGILGYFYLWYIVVVLLVPIGLAYLLYVILRKILDSKAEKENLDVVLPAADENEKLVGARNYDKYAINGQGNYGKSRMVEAVVNTYVRNNPSITIESLKEIFPYDLLSGYGVVRAADDSIKDYKRFYKSELADGTVFYICNQWGKDNTDNFVQHVNKNVAGIKVTNVE